MKGKIVVLLLVFSVFNFVSYASVQGAIKGTVKDEQGNPIADVEVVISSQLSQQMKLTLKTNEKGYYIQTGLHPGLYLVTFSKEGYITEQRRVRVRINEKTTVNIVMRKLPEKGVTSKLLKQYKKAISLIKESKWDEAGEILEKLIKENPDSANFYYDLAIVRKEQKRMKEAFELLKKAVELKPHFPDAYKAMGIILAKEGKFSEAIPYLEKAYQQNPSDPEVVFNLGVCHRNLGNNEKALDAFIKAIEIDASYADAYFEAGMIYFALNKKDETIKMLEKFISLDPENPNVSSAKEIINFLKSQK